jgi:hypothetical protein
MAVNGRSRSPLVAIRARQTFVKFPEDEGDVHLGLAGPNPLGSIVHMCNRIRFLTNSTK